MLTVGGPNRSEEIARSWRQFAQQICPNIRTPFDLNDHPDLLADLRDRLKALHEIIPRKDCGVSALVDAALGCVHLRVRDEILLQAISERSQLLLDRFNVHQLTNLTWAMVRLGYQDEVFFEAVANRALSRSRELSSHNRATLAWSLALAEGPASLEFVKDAYAILLQSHDPAELLQSHQAAAARGIIPPALPDYIANKIKECKTNSPSSRFERSVSSILKKLCLSQEIQTIIPRLEIAGIETDFVIVTCAGRWVVECDGSPFHCLNNLQGRTGQYVGNDLIQDKILKRAGYRVLHILDKVWSRLVGEQDKTNYLKAAFGAT